MMTANTLIIQIERAARLCRQAQDRSEGKVRLWLEVNEIGILAIGETDQLGRMSRKSCDTRWRDVHENPALVQCIAVAVIRAMGLDEDRTHDSTSAIDD